MVAHHRCNRLGGVRRWFVLCVSFFACLPFGVAPVQSLRAAPAAPATVVSYADPRGFFTLQYLDSWKVGLRPLADPDNVLVLEGEGAMIFVKAYRPRTTNAYDFDFFLDAAVSRYRDSEVTADAVQATQVGGIAAQERTTTVRSKTTATVAFVETAWLVESNGLRFYIQCTDVSVQGDAIRNMIASVAFAPPAAFTDAQQRFSVTYPRAWSETRIYADPENVVAFRVDRAFLSINVLRPVVPVGTTLQRFPDDTRRVNPGSTYTFLSPETGNVSGEAATVVRYEYRANSTGIGGTGALWLVERGGLVFWFQGQDLTEYGDEITAILDTVQFLV